MCTTPFSDQRYVGTKFQFHGLICLGVSTVEPLEIKERSPSELHAPLSRA